MFLLSPATPRSPRIVTRATLSNGKVRALIRSKWRTLLKGAHNEAAVLVLVRAFAGAWHADEIAAIPSELWPGRVITPRDVIDGAARIAQAHAEFAGDARELALLQELLLFMTQAAVRIVSLGQAAAATSDKARFVATEPEEGIGGHVPREAPAARLDDDA